MKWHMFNCGILYKVNVFCYRYTCKYRTLYYLYGLKGKYTYAKQAVVPIIYKP
ncbi:hypothetical protein [Clostridium butyricum]